MKKGIVIKSTGSWYTVKDESGKQFDCKIKGKFRIKGIKTTNPVAVGDSVSFESSGVEGENVIVSIDKRKNYIIRRSSNLSKQYHILASNVDQAIIMITIGFPETTTEFIDRFLVTAEAYSIPVVMVFNKVDMYNDELNTEINDLISVYEEIGYSCLKTSAKTGEGSEELKRILKDKTTVLSGHSGVGKSTLINYLDSTLDLKTGSISTYHLKGKHTTTYAEMFELDFGGSIIDTPGIKGFGVIDMEKEELFHFFPEIFKIAENCQFYNCVHIHEPGCAVKEAVENSTISYSRYASYLSLMEDEDDKYRLKEF